MVPVREFKDHHDDPDDLSLITESAEVLDVSALDHNRTNEIRPVVARLLDELEREDLITDTESLEIDWDGVDEIVNGRDDSDTLREKLNRLADRYHRPYPSLLSVRLRGETQPVDFVPGQYVTLRFHDTPRPYSVASSPLRDHLEFCLRRVPGGRLTADLFEDLEPGDDVAIRGPNGDFVMEDHSGRDLAFLATGTGVAPLRSMIRYTFESGRDTYEDEQRDVWLFLGSSWKDDLPYREEFRELARDHENFHFVPTLTREEYLTDWTGETSYVQETFATYLDDDHDGDPDGALAVQDEPAASGIDARIDPTNLEVYACGLTAMVEAIVDTVRRLGVQTEHVHGEAYG